MSKKKPIVAIVGRRMWKIYIVNRLIGARQSIVDDMPALRETDIFDVEWQHKYFTVIDTANYSGDEDEIMLSIFDQAQIACDEADKIIFLVDGKLVFTLRMKTLQIF